MKTKHIFATVVAMSACRPHASEAEGLSEAELAAIGSQVGDLIATKFAPIEKQIQDVQKDLNGLEGRGDITATDQKVKDLEEKLLEREEKLGEIMKQHNNELRLIKADFAMAGTQPGAAPDPLRQDWKNQFVKSPEALKQLVYSYAKGDSGSGMLERIDTSDIASAGALQPEVADRFIDNIIAEQATLSRITTRRMLSPSARLDEIRVANRQLTVTGETTDVSPAGAVSFAQRTLNTTEVTWAEDITLAFLEDNIERANGEAHIASVLARQFGTDLNDLACNGTTDTFAAAFTTIRQGLYSYMNTIAAGATPVTPREVTAPAAGSTPSVTFRAMHKAIQQKYKARTDWGFFVPTGTAEIYADEVQARETSLGDSVLLDGFPALRYFGRPIYPEPFLNDATVSTGNARPYLTSTQNMVFGIHRNIRVDSEFKPRGRKIEYTISARVGFNLAVPYLFVRLSDVLPSDQL